MKSLSVDLKDTGILIMAMHPGWVKTRMGGPNALIDTETCVSTMIQTLQGLTEKDHGSLLRYNNTSIPWWKILRKQILKIKQFSKNKLYHLYLYWFYLIY